MESKLVRRPAFYAAVGFILVAFICLKSCSAETHIIPISINITRPKIIAVPLPGFRIAPLLKSPPRAGYLWDVFYSIWEATGVFPDVENSDSQLIILNPLLNVTFHVDWTGIGNGAPVVTYLGGGNKGNLDAWGIRFHIRRVHDELVTFATKYSAGIGSGSQNGTLVFTGDWLDSKTHAFRILVYEKAAIIVNEQSGLCIEAGPDDADQLRTVTCNEHDIHQRWQICWDFTTCWPRDATADLSHLSI